MVDQLRRGLPLRLTHRLEDARLRTPAEIVIDGRGPAARRHVEVHRSGQGVGMSEASRAAVPRLMHGVDGERSAMRKQRGLAVAIEPRRCLPEIAFVLGQLLCPLLMAGLDRLGPAAVGQYMR